MEDFFHIIFDPSNHFYQVIVAVLLGVFIGLRRETLRGKERKKGADILGIRTTTLLVLLGTVATFFEDISFFVLLVFGGVFLLLLIAYINGVFRLNRYGLTTEISALLMFFMGVLIGREQVFLAILLAITLGISSAYKKHIHTFAQRFSLKEWSGTLQLLVISALILPLLPKEPIDPFGIFVPFSIWVLVILISGIGFIGYFFSKFFGEKKSIFLVSLLGALVSSTATTTALAERSKKPHANQMVLLIGVLIATAVMQARVIVEIVILSTHVPRAFIAVAVVMMIVALIVALIYYVILQKACRDDDVRPPEMHSPFEIVPALKFALFFSVILFAIHFGKVYFGDIGAYITTVIAAFADVDAVVFSALLSYGTQTMSEQFVGNIISIALIVNTAVKLLYIFLFGERSFFYKMLLPLGVVIAMGIGTVFFI